METAKKQELKNFSQFELTTYLLQNLKNFNLTPVAKLVLLELSSHYNEGKNNAVVFPSTPYIAETLGIGLTATKKAINDLINEGLIIKTKRDKVKGNYNKYAFTNKVRNTTFKRSENERLKESKSDRFMITEQHEQKKEQTVVVDLLKSFSFSEDEIHHLILKHSLDSLQTYAKYVQSKKAENPKKYLLWCLKEKPEISENKQQSTEADNVKRYKKLLNSQKTNVLNSKTYAEHVLNCLSIYDIRRDVDLRLAIEAMLRWEFTVSDFCVLSYIDEEAAKDERFKKKCNMIANEVLEDLKSAGVIICDN